MAPQAASSIATETVKPALAPARTAEPEHVPAQAKPNWQKYGTPLLVVLLAATVVFTITRNWNSWEGGRIEQVTDDAYVRGDLTPLSTKVAGVVRDVKVSDFQSVRKGDLLVQLDDDDYRAQVVSRQASLEQAKAMLSSSQSAVDAERRGLDVLNSQEVQLIADLRGKQAALTVSQVNLGYTKIEAPDDGTVGERQVRPGQFVSPGTQAISFVSKIKWVQANYRETQLTNVKVGDPAEIRIDAYPGKLFHGKVIEIAPASGSQFALLPPDNATGNYTKVVQRVPVKIAFDDPGIATTLRPGLSVIATVRTRH